MTLSEAERLVLHLISLGLRDPQIARRLSISEHTVNSRLDRIFRTLGARNRTHAVAIAIRAGVIS